MSINCNRSGLALIACFIKHSLKGAITVNCLLLTSTQQHTLEFLVALPCYIPVLSCSHISNIMLQWTHESCTDCTLFLATILWQPWISEVHTVVNWESTPLRHVAGWNVLLLWHDDSFLSNTGRICIESYAGPNNIFTETKLLSSKDTALLSQVPVTSRNGT